MKIPDLCPICLRTERDRELKVIDEKLAEFHDELCNYTIINYELKYCTECTYMLQKVYNFKARCNNSLKELKNWRKTKDKKPVELLYTYIPHTTLELWSPKNNRVYNIVHNGTNLILKAHSTKSPMRCSVDVEPNDSLLSFDEIKTEIDDNESLEQNLLEGTLTANNAEETETYMLLDTNDVKQEKELEDFDVDSDDDNKINIEKHSNSIKDEPYHNKELNGNTPMKKSLLELADITFSDDDFTFDDDAERKPKRESDLDSNDTLNESFVDGDSGTEYSITDTNLDDDAEETERKIIKKDNTKKRTVTMNRAITKSKNKGATIKGKRVNPNSLMPYTKERFKELLLKRFEKCGELKANDGTVIDKDVIMRCVDERVPEATLKRIWTGLKNKRVVTREAMILFRTVQINYERDLKYAAVFDIEYLNTTEKIIDEFHKRKTYKSYLDAIFKCDVCYQGFLYEKLLLQHQKHHDDEAGEHVCTLCKVRYKTNSELIRHNGYLHSVVYKCKLCPLITYYSYSVRNHYDQHNGKKYECLRCGTVYNSQSAYISHVSSVHPDGRHSCVTCGRTFLSLVALNTHQNKYNHKEHTPTAADVKCKECVLTFPSQKAYLMHRRIAHHAAYTRYKSTYSQRDWACRECNEKGNSYRWIVNHYKRTHPAVDMSSLYLRKQSYLCDVCGRGFKALCLLREHMNRHTDARHFACDLCPKRFWSKILLNNHRLFHYPPTKVCPHCGKKFHSNSNLSVHVRSHVDDRRYKCQICFKMFLAGNALRDHISGVHHKVRRVRKKVAGAKKKKIPILTE